MTRRPAPWTAVREGVRSRLLGRPTWVLVLVVFAASRILVGIVVQGAAMCCQTPAGVGELHPSYLDMVPIWDGTWYREIVAHGYPIPLPVDTDTGQVTFSAWAFYPLFPMALKVLTATGLPFTGAALLLNLGVAAVGTVLVQRLFEARAGRSRTRQRMALGATALWCLYPATAVLQVAYSEALGVALLAAFLWLLVERRYLWAALAVAALGFTRAIAPPLGLVVLVHLVLRVREQRRAGLAPLRGQRLSSLVLLASTGASAVAWPLVVGLATGRLDAFFLVQEAWGQRPDRGPFVTWLDWAWDGKGVLGVVLLVAVVAAYICLVLGRHGRWLAVELRAWALAYPLYLLAVVRPITSMWRFLLLDFPLAALAVSITVRGVDGATVRPDWRRWMVAVAAGLLLGVVAWTTVLLTYTPWSDTPP